MSSYFAETINSRTDQELLFIVLEERKNYKPEIVKAAEEEIQKRGGLQILKEKYYQSEAKEKIPLKDERTYPSSIPSEKVSFSFKKFLALLFFIVIVTLGLVIWMNARQNRAAGLRQQQTKIDSVNNAKEAERLEQLKK